MMNEMDAKQIVLDRTEDLFWTLEHDVDDEGRAQLHEAMNEFQNKCLYVLDHHPAKEGV